MSVSLQSLCASNAGSVQSAQIYIDNDEPHTHKRLCSLRQPDHHKEKNPVLISGSVLVTKSCRLIRDKARQHMTEHVEMRDQEFHGAVMERGGNTDDPTGSTV